MYRKRVSWILLMAVLCLALYTVVRSRAQNKTEVILGGVDGGLISSDSVNYTALNATPTPEPTEDIWPQIDITLSQYSLINSDPSHLLSSSYTPDVSEIAGSQYHMMFDSAALPYLEAMLEDLRNEGFGIYIGSAYRSYSYQKQLFDGKAYNIALEMGLEGDEIWLLPEYQEAVARAKTVTMEPGSSEHQLGLAVDLYDRHYNSPLVYENMNQKFYNYLDSICAKYGFIKRYPTRKLLLTGWDEPWHYRYVGVEAATFIMEQGICYEEFYKHYVPDFQY